MNEEYPKSVWRYIFTIAITAIIVGGGMYYWQITKESEETVTENQNDQQASTSQITLQKETPKVVEAKIEEGMGFEDTGWASIQENIMDKTGEIFQSFSSPFSPTNASLIYVSTSSGNSLTISNNKIYTYNIKTKAITKVYEENENRVLRTVGLDGTKLIVMFDLIDNSPGPCFSVWADWYNFGYLDIQNPSQLKPYTIPDYQVEKGKAEQKECLKDSSKRQPGM